jgi:predicted  nucleic acid-binding Zn-ribbon protein
MTSRRKWIATVAIASMAVALTTPSPASARNASSTHVSGAFALSAKNNKVDTQFRFKVEESRASVVTAVNGAYGTTAGCINCGAGAVSFQIVHAQNPNTAVVNARNEAKAYSHKCVECSNLAAAYQFVVVDPSGNPLTQHERHALRELESTLKALRDNGTPPADLAGAIDEIAGEVVAVLQGQSQNQRSTTARTVTLNRQVQAGN